MYKLEKQIIEMENFASHLEEVFITVEVRAHLTTLSDTRHFHRGWGQQLCLAPVRESVFLECIESVLPLSPHPSFCPPVAWWAYTYGNIP